MQRSITGAIIALALGWYGGVPLMFLLLDHAEERVVEVDGNKRTIFIEWDEQRVRLPAGCAPSALFSENGAVRKVTYLPPARFVPGVVTIYKDATISEAKLYDELFGFAKL